MGVLVSLEHVSFAFDWGEPGGKEPVNKTCRKTKVIMQKNFI